MLQGEYISVISARAMTKHLKSMYPLVSSLRPRIPPVQDNFMRHKYRCEDFLRTLLRSIRYVCAVKQLTHPRE